MPLSQPLFNTYWLSTEPWSDMFT